MVLRFPDGTELRVAPGPRGRGASVSLRPSGAARGTGGGAGTGRRGRPPRASTVALRNLIQADMQKGNVKPARDYFEWLVRRDPEVAEATARQVVYRELRLAGARPAPSSGGRRGRPAKRGRKGGRKAAAAAAEGEARRGRQPSEATRMLREQIQKDLQGGGVKDAASYVRWLVDAADLGIRQARPLVYRELRASR